MKSGPVPQVIDCGSTDRIVVDRSDCRVFRINWVVLRKLTDIWIATELVVAMQLIIFSGTRQVGSINPISLFQAKVLQTHIGKRICHCSPRSSCPNNQYINSILAHGSLFIQKFSILDSKHLFDEQILASDQVLLDRQPAPNILLVG